MEKSDELLIELILDLSVIKNNNKITIDRELLIKLFRAYNLLYEQNIDMSREHYL